jgi:UDP-3-O-[3-hydroxymyristoyl] glucosamine N-acyltransferase
MEYPLANVHPEAKIGKDVIIEPFVTIEKEVEIGDGCWIGANAVIKIILKLAVIAVFFMERLLEPSPRI